VIFNRICNHVPYRVSWSGLKSALSIRPNLASYEAEAGAGKLGLNKLRRLVNYMDNHRQSFSREERAAIEGMIISPMSCENDQRSRDLAQRGYNILVLLDNADKLKPARVVDEFRLDIPDVAEREAVPPPAPSMYSETEVIKFDPQGQIGQRVEAGAIIPNGMRPQINIWQSTCEEPQNSIADAVLNYIKAEE